MNTLLQCSKLLGVIIPSAANNFVRYSCDTLLLILCYYKQHVATLRQSSLNVYSTPMMMRQSDWLLVSCSNFPSLTKQLSEFHPVRRRVWRGKLPPPPHPPPPNQWNKTPCRVWLAYNHHITWWCSTTSSGSKVMGSVLHQDRYILVVKLVVSLQETWELCVWVAAAKYF